MVNKEVEQMNRRPFLKDVLDGQTLREYAGVTTPGWDAVELYNNYSQIGAYTPEQFVNNVKYIEAVYGPEYQFKLNAINNMYENIGVFNGVVQRTESTETGTAETNYSNGTTSNGTEHSEQTNEGSVITDNNIDMTSTNTPDTITEGKTHTHDMDQTTVSKYDDRDKSNTTSATKNTQIEDELYNDTNTSNINDQHNTTTATVTGDGGITDTKTHTHGTDQTNQRGNNHTTTTQDGVKSTNDSEYNRSSDQDGSTHNENEGSRTSQQETIGGNINMSEEYAEVIKRWQNLNSWFVGVADHLFAHVYF